MWSTHTSKSQPFFIPIALRKILKEVKIQCWQRWKELGTLKIYFWNQISKGYLLLSNCGFALLNFAIWCWNKFISEFIHSTGNYIQYPIINQNEKEYCKCIYSPITLLYTRNQHTTVNQLHSNTIKKKRVIGGHLGGCLPQARLTFPFGCFLYFVIIILFFPWVDIFRSFHYIRE